MTHVIRGMFLFISQIYFSLQLTIDTNTCVMKNVDGVTTEDSAMKRTDATCVNVTMGFTAATVKVLERFNVLRSIYTYRQCQRFLYFSQMG